MGLVLEALHGFKVGAYLDLSNETRRLMWTLAHAHGTLLALVQLGLAATLPALAQRPPATLASPALDAASVLLPAGFFLGGFGVHGGDPGVGILLVPVGALLLIGAVAAIAVAATRA